MILATARWTRCRTPAGAAADKPARRPYRRLLVTPRDAASPKMAADPAFRRLPQHTHTMCASSPATAAGSVHLHSTDDGYSAPARQCRCPRISSGSTFDSSRRRLRTVNQLCCFWRSEVADQWRPDRRARAVLSSTFTMVFADSRLRLSRKFPLHAHAVANCTGVGAYSFVVAKRTPSMMAVAAVRPGVERAAGALEVGVPELLARLQDDAAHGLPFFLAGRVREVSRSAAAYSANCNTRPVRNAQVFEKGRAVDRKGLRPPPRGQFSLSVVPVVVMSTMPGHAREGRQLDVAVQFHRFHLRARSRVVGARDVGVLRAMRSDPRRRWYHRWPHWRAWLTI